MCVDRCIDLFLVPGAEALDTRWGRYRGSRVPHDLQKLHLFLIADHALEVCSFLDEGERSHALKLGTFDFPV